MAESASGVRLIVGFDVGGTFTDVIACNSHGSVVIEKVLTTPHDPAVGARQGVLSALRRWDATVADVELGVHATTLVTNAIIERRGAAVGMITNRGFRDVVEIGGGTRYDIYDLFLPFPKPLVDRRLRREVAGRVGADGSELTPLDLGAAKRELAWLRGEGARAVAVCFLHSYRDDSHEQAIRALVEAEFPELEVSLSSGVGGQLGEVERFSTATANAYVQPLMKRYLEELDTLFPEGRLLLMASNGGTISLATAQEWPIVLIESGPAAGALAAAAYSRRLRCDRVVSFDMGGTTAKVCLIDDGKPVTSNEFEAARAERFKPGSGVPLQIPVINLIEIGAGGGSVAYVNDLGLLKVGPLSAGADPGPACYGLGGQRPTVTDANLVLGYLDADSFLGGDMTLSREAAEAAVLAEVAAPLNIELVQAAWSIHEIVNENMAAAMRMHIAERNRDPRSYSMIAFGGAGPAHAVAIARKVGIREVIVPLGAGATSAYGLLVANPVIELAHTRVVQIGEIDWNQIDTDLRELETRAVALLEDAGVRGSEVRSERSVDMRYAGQAHEISVPLDAGDLDEHSEARLLARFAELYADLYSSLNPDFEVEALHWRIRASGPARDIRLSAPAKATGAAPGARRVYFSSLGFSEAPVFQHAELDHGSELMGPAIVEQRESTAVVGPGDLASVDHDLNLIIQLDGGATNAR